MLSIFYHRHVVTFCISFSTFLSHRMSMSMSKSILFYFEQYINSKIIAIHQTNLLINLNKDQMIIQSPHYLYLDLYLAKKVLNQ